MQELKFKKPIISIKPKIYEGTLHIIKINPIIQQILKLKFNEKTLSFYSTPVAFTLPETLDTFYKSKIEILGIGDDIADVHFNKVLLDLECSMYDNIRDGSQTLKFNYNSIGFEIRDISKVSRNPLI